MKAKINLKNIKSYIVGNLRYKLFYSNFAFLIPTHIREQIQYRINSMDIECYENGYCKMCGCQTTALQMANKACDKPCYPAMVSRNIWNLPDSGFYDKETKIVWDKDKDNLKFLRLS